MLSGGLGNDRFVFRKISDSGMTSTTRDVVSDFRRGDKIDLFRIDADTTSRAIRRSRSSRNFPERPGNCSGTRSKAAISYLLMSTAMEVPIFR